MAIDGMNQMLANMRRIAKGANGVAGAAVNAGLNVMAASAKSASPGSISQEIGKRRGRSEQNIVRGVVGLGVGAAARIKNPHGHFLTAGTKYIVARHFIRRAFEASAASAFQAMKRAASRRLSKLVTAK